MWTTDKKTDYFTIISDILQMVYFSTKYFPHFCCWLYSSQVASTEHCFKSSQAVFECGLCFHYFSDFILTCFSPRLSRFSVALLRSVVLLQKERVRIIWGIILLSWKYICKLYFQIMTNVKDELELSFDSGIFKLWNEILSSTCITLEFYLTEKDIQYMVSRKGISLCSTRKSHLL